MKAIKAKELIGARKIGAYFEMDGISTNMQADEMALKCIDMQLKLRALVSNWEYGADRRFTGEAVKDILKQFVVEE